MSEKHFTKDYLTYEQIYRLIREEEKANKNILLEFQADYPNVINIDNVDEIIAAIRKKQGN